MNGSAGRPSTSSGRTDFINLFAKHNTSSVARPFMESWTLMAASAALTSGKVVQVER